MASMTGSEGKAETRRRSATQRRLGRTARTVCWIFEYPKNKALNIVNGYRYEYRVRVNLLLARSLLALHKASK